MAAMDVLETLNRRFGGLHERLFGHLAQRELRPQDILRRIVTEMETARRKGLDGHWYVPNVFTLQVAVGSDDERQYLRTFLGAEELVSAVAAEIESRTYRVKGTLLFTVEEVPPAVLEQRIRVLCRFDPTAANTGTRDEGRGTRAEEPERGNAPPKVAPLIPHPSSLIPSDDEEPGTVAAGAQAVAQMVVFSNEGSIRATYPVTLAGARIGRSRREGNTVIIDGDPQISKRHARLSYEKGNFVLYDEGSTNGTVVRGNRLATGVGVPVSFDEDIKIGETHIVLRSLDTRSAPIRTPPMFAEPVTQATPAVAVLPQATLLPQAPPAYGSGVPGWRLISGDGRTFPLASEMTIGRGATEDIVLAGNGIALASCPHHTARRIALSRRPEFPGRNYRQWRTITGKFPGRAL